MKDLLIVGIGGGIGSIARLLSQRGVQRMIDLSFPLGTFLINVIGSFIIGVVYALSERGNFLTPEIRLFLTVGFCGGFTTFSTFSYDNYNMISEKLWQYLVLNVGGSIFFGILAVYLGVATVRYIFS
jgi:CrcB protein